MSCSIEGCTDPVFSECKGERGGYTYNGPHPFRSSVRPHLKERL